MSKMSRVVVGVVPIELVASNGNRRALFFRNNGAGSIFIGGNAQVTIATGVEIPMGQQFNSEGGDVDAYWGVCAVGTQQVDVMEIL